MQAPRQLVQLHLPPGADCIIGIRFTEESSVNARFLPVDCGKDLVPNGMTVIFRVEAPSQLRSFAFQPCAERQSIPKMVPVIFSEDRGTESEVDAGRGSFDGSVEVQVASLIYIHEHISHQNSLPRHQYR
ncbi:hypothetical protein [Arthrobacter bambusae]|uniref:hypothetical protein n=1 Tax=Arthrobacter bambusae TaxID=1338426 RepID=UPI00278B73FA|nr:hypothetical protein [Arthrobacter bambusae]MDQ0030928.1 hypothetical protein [Arthrobacter bambusae]MDQ0099293.1 hypothetical protein [Arthrobacter bambusae]